MAARKLTKSPEGEVVTFSTKRGKPDTCSETCGGIYRFKGELYCKYFHNVVGKRDEECIKNEVTHIREKRHTSCIRKVPRIKLR